jgi:hypothetical protein
MFLHHIFCGIILQVNSESPELLLDDIFPEDQYKCIKITSSIVAISINAYPDETLQHHSPILDDSDYQRGYVKESKIKAICSWFLVPSPEEEGEYDHCAKLMTLFSEAFNQFSTQDPPPFKLFVQNMNPQYYILTQRCDTYTLMPVATSPSIDFPIENKINDALNSFTPQEYTSSLHASIIYGDLPTIRKMLTFPLPPSIDIVCCTIKRDRRFLSANEYHLYLHYSDSVKTHLLKCKRVNGELNIFTTCSIKGVINNENDHRVQFGKVKSNWSGSKYVAHDREHDHATKIILDKSTFIKSMKFIYKNI